MNEQSSDIDQQLAALTASSTEPTQPTPETSNSETQTSTTEPKTDAQKWREYLETFPDVESARKAVKAKSAETGWATGSGYRAIKQIKKWKNGNVKAKEATFKITKMEIPDVEPEPTPDTPTDYPPSPTPTPEPTYNQAVSSYAGDYKTELSGVMQDGAVGTVKNVLSMVSKKLTGENGKDVMTDKREKNLGILLPHWLGKITQNPNLSYDDYVNYATGLYIADIATEMLAEKIEQMGNEPSKPESAPEQPPAKQPAPAEQPASTINSQFHDSKPKYGKDLPR